MTLTTPPSLSRKMILLLVMVAGVGGSYWVNFIWFYLKIHWETTPATNLVFNAGFGLLYTIGCLVTARVSRRLSARTMLIVGFSILILLTILSSRIGTANGIGAIILAHAFIITWTWPNLEMLAASGLHGPALGAAISRYNIAWAGSSAVAYAVAGSLYEFSHVTLFLVPCLAWAVSIAIVMAFIPWSPPILSVSDDGSAADEELARVDPAVVLHMRTLSRAGNMASYVLISTLVPIMPMITHKLGLAPAAATAFGSLWLVSRVFAFVALGRWHGWHFHLRLFLIFMISMPILFGAVVLSNSLIIVGLAQILLGFALGKIYSGALFYSLHGQAETSQAAIHEAVIGVGIMMGPLLSAGAGYWGEKMGWPETRLITIAVISPLVLICLWMIQRSKPGVN